MHSSHHTSTPDEAHIELLRESVTLFLEKLAVEVDEVVITSKHRTIVALKTPHPHILIGPEGEHLRALNTLMHRFIEKKLDGEAVNFLIDVNGYHEDKLEKVRDAARMLAQRARLFKHAVEMEPMSAYERLVVHELFAEDPQIKTTSEGEGAFRHIVLTCR